eukprot:TRINITY_DN4510_c0_g1_i1.p1 TRINITY_DN4510_c0_g1~~TRINITY_DN4510_c0_g1_i1.p1  ORF type:complete len:575 (+),score=199.58 TRINITY_DN4510_c0_g1_i1:159-1883(+)
MGCGSSSAWRRRDRARAAHAADRDSCNELSFSPLITQDSTVQNGNHASSSDGDKQRCARQSTISSSFASTCESDPDGRARVVRASCGGHDDLPTPPQSEEASSGSASTPPESDHGHENFLNPTNNPYGTFEREGNAERRKSCLNQVVSDMPEEAPEDFLFTDFTIDKEEIKAIKARKADNRKRGGPAVRGMKPRSGEDHFQFSDFAVNVVSDLEEEIVRAHLQKKKEAGQVLRTTEEEAMFQFGDFQISKADKATVRKPEQGRRAIRNYECTALIGHSTRVKTICLIPNEKSYVSCSNMDTDLGMYDIRTGREIVSFVGHESTVTGASFSCNSKFIATTSTDYNMILWDVMTGKQVFVFEHVKIVICSCFSTDGKYLLSGSQDKICRVWDTRKGRLVRSYNDHSGIIISVSYAPNGDLVASASSDKTLRIWNATTGLRVHLLTGHTGIVLSCQYSFDGARLVSNDEHFVRVWNTQSGQAILRLSVDGISPISSGPAARKCTWTLCSYCPGQSQPIGYYIVAACSDRTVRIFQSTTGKELLYFYCKAAVYCLSSGTKEKMVFGDSYGNVYVVTLA